MKPFLFESGVFLQPSLRFVFFFLLVFLNWTLEASPKKILFLGDSLTEGFGVAQGQAYPALVQKALKEEGIQIEALNAGVSGSTSASALSRLKWHLRSKPDLVILALGSNDGLRALSVEEMKKNLAQAIELIQAQNIKVLLVGFQMPPNYTQSYAGPFKKVFPDLAKKYKLPFVPFLLEGVAGVPSLNLPDGIHPNAEGQKKLAQTILVHLRKLL